MTPEAVDRICQALSEGNYRNVAAEWAGVSPRVMREWMAKGRAEKKGPHRDFRRRVLEAEKQAEIRCVGLIMKAAAEDAKHAQWWLERKFPSRWARKDRPEMKLTHDVNTSDASGLVEIVRRLAGEQPKT
jgi:hypothetical protein